MTKTFEVYFKGHLVVDAASSEKAVAKVIKALESLNAREHDKLTIRAVQQGSDAPWRGGIRECQRSHDDGNCGCDSNECSLADGGYGR